jgi:DNA excision repair protein ERCC-2
MLLLLLRCVQMVSRELEKECVVVFDEAHNIDNVCIEALSVNLRKHTLQAARNNIRKLHDVSRAAHVYGDGHS